MPDANTSALARRLAKTHNLDLSTLMGSGANGLVTARDVLEYLEHETNLNAADSASETSVQKAEVEAETNAVIETAPQHKPRVEKMITPSRAAEKEESQAQANSEAPRWMFWRR